MKTSGVSNGADLAFVFVSRIEVEPHVAAQTFGLITCATELTVHLALWLAAVVPKPTNFTLTSPLRWVLTLLPFHAPSMLTTFGRGAYWGLAVVAGPCLLGEYEKLS